MWRCQSSIAKICAYTRNGFYKSEACDVLWSLGLRNSTFGIFLTWQMSMVLIFQYSKTFFEERNSASLSKSRTRVESNARVLEKISVKECNGHVSCCRQDFAPGSVGFARRATSSPSVAKFPYISRANKNKEKKRRKKWPVQVSVV